MPNVRIGDVDLAPGNSGNVARGDDILISRGGVDRRAHLNGKLLLPAFTLADAGKIPQVAADGNSMELVAGKGADSSPTLADGETFSDKYRLLIIEVTDTRTRSFGNHNISFSGRAIVPMPPGANRSMSVPLATGNGDYSYTTLANMFRLVNKTVSINSTDTAITGATILFGIK